MPSYDLDVNNFACVKEFVKEDVRVRLVEFPRGCGHHGYVFCIDRKYSGMEEWKEVATIGDPALFRSLKILADAEAYVHANRWMLNCEMVFAEEE